MVRNIITIIVSIFAGILSILIAGGLFVMIFEKAYFASDNRRLFAIALIVIAAGVSTLLSWIISRNWMVAVIPAILIVLGYLLLLFMAIRTFGFNTWVN